MIDVDKVREAKLALKTGNEMLLKNGLHPLSIAETLFDEALDEHTITELDRLQKRETPMKPLHVMFTWQCKECGSELRDTWNFCPHCGKQLDWSDEK